MGDQQKCHPARGTGLEDQVDHRPAGVAVEIAGRLVGEQQARPVDQGAGQRHALLLATRKLARIVVEALLETDFGEEPAGGGEGVAVACELHRQRHILPRGHGRDQMERLEQDAQPIAPKFREPILVEMPEIDAVDGTRPAVGRSIPPTIDIRLDLPEPEGPTTLTLAPASTTRSMPRRIATGPAALDRVRCTSASWIIGKGSVPRASVVEPRGRWTVDAGPARPCCSRPPSSPWRCRPLRPGHAG